MIFHIDANSFYASCEQLFRPDLKGKAVAVLSNNDGIIIALNGEAKEKGLARGDAWFEVKEVCDKEGITVFSSNYTLYADISARIVTIYNRLCPTVEVYSIDECFLYYPEWKSPDFPGLAWHIKETVMKEVGMPVSIGIAPTRTLAKMCNKLAKKRGGVLSWEEVDKQKELSNYPVSEIWGIGRSKAKMLTTRGIHTAEQLRTYPLHMAKKNLTINGMRTVQELNGIRANEQLSREKTMNICSSKSFAEPVYILSELEEALAEYVHEAVRRMRSQKSRARFISVFLMTSPWDDSGPQYSNQLSASFTHPTSFLPEILRIASELLHTLYRSGYRYRKIMVNLIGLDDDSELQRDLFEDRTDSPQNRQIMRCFDDINARYGKTTIRMGALTLAPRGWKMKRNLLSPSYTTDIRNIPEVY